MNEITECADNTTVVYPLFQAECGGSIPTSALQLWVSKIDLDRLMEINRKWHSRLPRLSKSNITRSRWYYCFGAEYQGHFHAVALWTNPVARLIDDGSTLELRRMAVGPTAPKNTPSRFLSVMVRFLRKRNKFKRLVSYQDTEVHTGTIYKASGWVVGALNKNGEWTRPNRERQEAQSLAPKIRWELALGGPV